MYYQSDAMVAIYKIHSSTKMNRISLMNTTILWYILGNTLF